MLRRLAFVLMLPVVQFLHAEPPKYSIQVNQAGDASWSADLKFADTSRPSVKLVGDDTGGPLWPPEFHTSPDARWILYIQKTGSGQNVAWLYIVDDTGRVLRLETPLDTMGWQFSDTVSTLKHSQLYHTRVSEWQWTDRQTLTFTLQGSDSQKSGSGVTLALEYDLAKNKLSRR